MASYKKNAAGEAERLAVLQRVHGQAKAIFYKLKENLQRNGAAPDDLLDALAAAVTGLIGGTRLQTLPATPERDSKGLPMEMVYSVP